MGGRRGSGRRSRTAIAGIAILALAACGAGRGDPAVILDALSEAGADSVYPAHTLRESMPNQAFVLPGGERVRGSESVVVGRVVSGEIRSAHAVVGESVVDVPPGSDGATWSMATVELEVEEAWGDLAGAETVMFLLPIRGGRTDEQLASIRALGRIVVFLADGRVGRNEELLGLVADDDRITFPVAAGAGVDLGRFLEGIDTLAELRAELAQSRPDIPLGEGGARVAAAA
jgi:hypothetical protein